VSESPPRFSAADLRTRARASLLRDAPDLDDAMSGARRRLDPIVSDPPHESTPPRRAAVLVPVRDRADQASVILTERSIQMPSHAGQISFPGGRISSRAESIPDAALREAEEEIGLAREQAQIIGYLDAYLTGTGFLIAPVVAVVDGTFAPVIEEREVASVFEVPLGFLMDPANHAIHERDIAGRSRRFYAMTYGERFIWGATAAMLKNLYDRVYARC
jgi:8-oxo-dGTP pyrophosphatase MutT (NUDIX family)